MATYYTLCREERLRGRRVFSNLFEKGNSFFQTPYKVFWMKIAEEGLYPCLFAVSVSKRRFKRAVKRNLLKRRTREVFRTNKQIISSAITDGGQVHIAFIYSLDELLPSTCLEEAMKKILLHIAQQYAKYV